MSDDPWKDIPQPSAASAISARRVGVDIRWGFYWARDIEHKYLLVLRHSSDIVPINRLPKLRGIEVVESQGETHGESMLVFRLLDESQRDIFHRLCVDIVDHADSAATESDAVEIALARTWRWHHFLRGGRDQRLSTEEQKGLIGELLLLSRYLLPTLTTSEAVRAWRGPLGAPKDFEIGRTCIEAKTRRGGATPFLAISSEHQLNTDGIDSLLLYVTELHEAVAGTDRAFSLPELIAIVRGRINETDGSAVEIFDGLLSAAGYDVRDDYSNALWIEGAHQVYRVAPGFPRITPHSFDPGVSYVRYSISLIACAPYIVEADQLEAALKGQ